MTKITIKNADVVHEKIKALLADRGEQFMQRSDALRAGVENALEDALAELSQKNNDETEGYLERRPIPSRPKNAPVTMRGGYIIYDGVKLTDSGSRWASVQDVAPTIPNGI